MPLTSKNGGVYFKPPLILPSFNVTYNLTSGSSLLQLTGTVSTVDCLKVRFVLSSTLKSASVTVSSFWFPREPKLKNWKMCDTVFLTSVLLFD